MTERSPLRVLWLTPDKPASISVGRRRISVHLESNGYAVTLRGTTGRTLARTLCERGTYDVVLGTTRAGAIAGMLVSRIHGVPLIVDHIDPIRQFRETASRPMARAVEWLEHRTFGAADHVLYVYDEEADRVRRHATAVTKTSLGVDFDRFAEPDPAAVERAAAAMPDAAEQVAIYVGGLEPMYNVDALLETAHHLADRSLVILGTGSLQDRVETVAAERDHLHYLGTVAHDDVPGYLAAADVGVSLVDDPHTLKVLEYFAAGLPVVHLEGRAETRFRDLATYTRASPPAIAEAIRTAGSQAGADERRAFARQYDWAAIAETYASVVETVRS